MLKRNLIANYLGQGWVALMGLAFIPLYIKYLGIEAYGLIGVFAILQAWLSLLDMGMTPTLSREMARFTAGEHSTQSIRNLLRSIEYIAITIAILITGGIWLAAEWLASDWLQAETLPTATVAQAFVIMGVVTGLRFVEGIYRSTIIGLQKQVLFNWLSAVMATLRGLGAVAILAWYSNTLQAFFIWQGLISILTVIILALATYHSIPDKKLTGRFSIESLRSIGRFAGGMMGITFLALLLTQVDKIILSKLLTLTEYGYYALAVLVAGILYQLVGPITQAFYPRLCQLHTKQQQQQLNEIYHKGAQLVSVIAGSVAITIIFFAETLLQLWTQNHDLAARTAEVLSVLMLGNLLNGLMHIPYQTQLAHGWTSFAVWVNIVSVAIIIPAILWVTPIYGAVGAAWVWVALNAGYVLISTHFMYRKIMIGEKWKWYFQDILFPLGAAFLVAIILWKIMPSSNNTFIQLAQLTIASIFILTVAVITASQTRSILVKSLQNIKLIALTK